MEALMTVLRLIVALASLTSGPATTVDPNESLEEVHVETGADVLLRCRCRRHSEITALKWSRSDLDEYVFFYRDKRPYEHYQNPLYQGRVQPVDPLMSSRNLSIILSNATMEDTGTFYCKVGLARGNPEETLHIIHLQVVPPTDPPEGPREGGGSGGVAPLNWALPVSVLVLIGVAVAAVFIYRRIQRSRRCHQHPNDSL